MQTFAHSPSLRRFGVLLLSLFAAVLSSLAATPPAGLVTRVGDQSIVLHWNQSPDSDLAGYRVYRATSEAGPFTSVTPSLLTIPGYFDANAINGRTNFYRVVAVSKDSQESAPSETVLAIARPFADDDEFLEYVQQTSFDYFWYGANPKNGLVPDRSPTPAPCSVAAVGFGLSAVAIGIDHGWITRSQGVERVRTTLKTFRDAPQGPGNSGTIGYKGWFYHFLDMDTAVRYAPFNSELSSIDTALFLAGVLHCKQYFNGTNAGEADIREMADTLYHRVDWNWMAEGTNVLSMGWMPGSGFLPAKWVGYNEAMILYIMGLGAATNPLPASSWGRWTNGYNWATYYGQSFIPFPPLFGHQYSHCWIDFRHIADDYMLAKESTYFENSRRATLAQQAYCAANPFNRVGYSSNVWGITASDVPNGYSARGAPPPENDDGTIAPTAAGGSIAFAPEPCLNTLKHFYRFFRRSIWTSYGFRDAFNQGAQWWATDTIGIDQGPFVLMIENYRNQKVWNLFMQNPEIQRGLERAGFKALSFPSPKIKQTGEAQPFELNWQSHPGRAYQVEYSADLASWFWHPGGRVTATNTLSFWSEDLVSAPQRFYRVLQFGYP